MKFRIHRLLFLWIYLSSTSMAISAQDSILSPRIASYNIDVILDTDNKKLTADQELTWINRSPDTIFTLYFHLYYNAFRNSESTFIKERGLPAFLTHGIDEHCGWSWVRINRMTDPEGHDLADGLVYVHPDDDNDKDMTVAKVALARSLLPGDTIVLDIAWEAKIPRIMPRTGYNKDYYFFAQWFPKIGVYEPAGMRYSREGAWNCHQYHSRGEYYADFGNYDVSMTVPMDFTVAASGVLIGTESSGDQKIWHFRANDVIDFAWAASPHFQMVSEDHGDARIKIYTYPYKVHMADRYMPVLKFAMTYLEEHLGSYPYPAITLIDAPIHGMFTGGMEYPTLITSISSCFFPRGIRFPETLAVHEYIHQYFMQMVATNETEDPWMDEGITTYYEGRIMDAYLGADRSVIDVCGITSGNEAYNRIEFFNFDHPQVAPNTLKSWEFVEGGYGEISYNKTALWLRTMEGLIGTPAMDSIMRLYFETWRFRHPDRYDFTNIVNEYVREHLAGRFPDGMDWYFEQVLYGTDLCDYSVVAIENEEVSPPRGFFEHPDSCEVLDSPQYKFVSKVMIHRLEGVKVPQEIVLEYEDGKTSWHYWDGVDPAHSIMTHGDAQVVSATIDPHFKIYMDSNFLNNSLTIRKQSGSLRRLKSSLLSAMQHLLESLSFII